MLEDILKKFEQEPGLEKKLHTDMKGYVPRMVPSPGPQTEAYLSEADILLYGGSPGSGKRLWTGTLVPVPLSTDSSGFKKHGEIKPGDYVYGLDGVPVKVIKSHKIEKAPESYDVHFSTGEIIKADADHNWLTWTDRDRKRKLTSTDEWRVRRRETRPSRAVPQVRTTVQIKDTLYRSDGGLNHSIDVVMPVQCEDIDLPADPYLFGLWLGDGYTRSPDIIMMTSDWGDIEKHIAAPRKIIVEGREKGRKQEVQIRGFDELKFIRKMRGKFIPAVYKRSSVNQRFELLRGMMDADGTCDRRGHCNLGFSNKRLAEDALEVINSLGIKCAIRRKKMRSAKHSDHYRMEFISDISVFKLKRKAERQRHIRRDTCRRRYIEKITPCAPVEMNCLTVEGGLYCVGNTFIVTHNTGLLHLLAYNEHDRSLIVRKQFSDLEGVTDNARAMFGSDTGFVGGMRPKYKMGNGRVIHWEGMPSGGGIDTGKQGNARDFIGVDEGAQLSEIQIRALFGWLRPLKSKPGQRCRMVIASNPPLDPVGDWMIEFFGPWLNPNHPHPAKDGELRYFIFDDNDKSREVAGPGKFDGEGNPYTGEGKAYDSHSRTFIRGMVEDNPYLDSEDYRRRIDIMPEPFRTILREGNFMYARKDQAFQVIPTQWVREAQARWKPEPYPGIPMCAMGVDPARGGECDTTIAYRHDGWYAPIIAIPGKLTPRGTDVAGHVVSHRRDNAHVVIDMGGGYGGAPLEHLEKNLGSRFVHGHVPGGGSSERTEDGSLKFFNARSEMWWRFREALDPGRPGGSWIALPPDSVLVADLTAPTFSLSNGRIKVESKQDGVDDKGNPKPGLVKRLGRSPDRGDAVVLAWSEGNKALQTHVTYNTPEYMRAADWPGSHTGHAKVVDKRAHRRRK